ncbi:hypothetical protein, partial [Streptomyces sp. NPDC008121]|uniref:hypothetical protein n=1 Tax=Streptomyces sp. NPDC008121 TaxID=3364809 RepID=UPI0036EFB667
RNNSHNSSGTSRSARLVMPSTTSQTAKGNDVLGEHRLITPLRSEGGHRRYSRYQLRITARARELVDQGTPIEAACRIIVLEDQLEQAQRINAEYRRAAESASPAAAA